MDRSESESGMLTSSHMHPDDDIVQLVDQWVRQFERETDERPDTLPTKPPPPATEPRIEDRSRSPLESMRSDWNRFGRRARGGGTPPETSSAPTTRATADPPPVKSTGLLTTFTDRIGGSISLSQADGRLQHRGTVALRGRCASVEAACQEIGLPAQVTRAFEFVAAWFGFPFDSANLRVPDGHILSWGFWGFAGEELVRCLYEWKRQAPDAFDTYLGAFGLDVQGGERGSQEATGQDRLTLSVQSDKRSIQGRAAEWTIAAEPRLLAVLARAGRDATAQKTQIDMTIANWVTPVLFHQWDLAGGGEPLTVDVLKSPKSVAALLYLVRRHGPRAATRLVQVVNERCRPQDDEEAWLAGLVRSLRNLKRENDASEVLRISSSPELTTE